VLLSLLVVSAFAADDLEKGKSIYVARCQSCHGEGGKGDGPAARALPKKPKDFSDAAYWTATDEKQLRLFITEGKPGTIMRGFPMPDDQLAILVLYLQSMPTAAATPAPAH
jgi:mono/diheme cytochrome c family protein